MPPRTGHNVASPARLVHSTPAPVLSKRSPADTAPDPRGAGENYDPEYYTTPKTPDAPILQETSRGIVAPIAGRSGEALESRVHPNLVRRSLHVLVQHEPRQPH